MSKDTIIKAGYRLTIVSWENDADNYNTKIIEGLNRQGAAFHVDLCKALQDDNLNNMYEPDEAECQRVYDALAKIMFEHGRAEDETSAGEHAHDFLYDMGLAGGEWFTRVCESYKVEHVEHDIHLKDVTEEF